MRNGVLDTQKYRGKTAQEIQDEIWDRMPLEKKIKLVSDFSRFLIQLNKLGDSYGASAVNKNREDFNGI